MILVALLYDLYRWLSRKFQRPTGSVKFSSGMTKTRWVLAWFLLYVAIAEVVIGFYMMMARGFPWNSDTFMFLAGTCMIASIFLLFSIRLILRNLQFLHVQSFR